MAVTIPLEIGDVILAGKFKNKKMVVKEFGIDDHGQPTVNGKNMLNFRIQKLQERKEKHDEAKGMGLISSLANEIIKESKK